MAAVGRVQARPVGRDEELAVLDQFLVTGGGFHGLVLVGGPGIGKSTLWKAGVAAAPERGSRVLSACASGAEARLAFAGLIDLFKDVGDETLATLPGPQQRALRVALLRIEPEGAAPEAGAIALGALNALRTLAALDRLLIAIDDVQWLDAPSADALAFVIRRLDLEPIGFLLARRAGWASAVESAFGPSRAEQLEIGPLSLGAIRRLLATRLGLNLPRHVLRRVVDATLGNPLFALELGRMLVEEGVPTIGEELPVPDAVEDLVGTRVAGLPPAMRRLLLAVALSADPSASELEAIAGSDALAEAVDAGLLHVDGERVRASHPLLAAAARKHSQSALRRDLHLELARVVADEELRARHLALATEGTDEVLARIVGLAAANASARGACREAVELAEQALRLTPPSASERPDRVLALAGYLETAGERQRVTDLLMPELEFLPRGAARVRAWLLLSEGGAVKSYHDHARYFDRALAESRGDRRLRASVLAAQALNTVAEGVERIREAEAWAGEALDEAMVGSPELEQLALRALSWARSLRGQPFEDACERFGDTADHAAHLMDSPGVVAGLRLAWRGEVERAREILTRFLALADVRGEAVSYAWLRLNMCELELRTGEWQAVSRRLDEWAESHDGQLLITPTYQRCRALLAVGQGHPDDAERWAAEARADAQVRGYRWQVLEASRALGIAALLAREPGRALEILRAVWDHGEREGIEEPGAFPVAPDLVEAQVELGELDEARVVTARLRALSVRQSHPWGLATAKRCDGVVGLASGFDEQAADSLEQAAADYRALGLHFDAARSLLALGRAQRRHRKWGAARRSLEAAEDGFADLGSPGWVDEARAELARVGARRPQPAGELTPAERRVAELAGEGLANKEIAQTLFVSVKTVEGHLSHVYAKLGVRSRAQLARRLSSG